MKKTLALITIFFFCLTCPGFAAKAKKTETKEDPKAEVQNIIGRNLKLGVQASEFPGGLDWFNVKQPLAIQDLKGKIILLNFWTSCDINCIRVVPDLKKLEEKYSNDLVVIGVHTAKFDNEKISGNIRKSILRYELKYPVVNDFDMQFWRKYDVSSWPTFILIDPQGSVVLQVSGEGNYKTLDEAVAELIRLGKRDSTLKSGPFELKQEQDGMENETLRFPGKIRAYSDRLLIADTNHNRILVTDLNGKILETIGSGKEGRADGSFSEAEFNHPQGMFLDGEFIYIADTDNHLIRRADLNQKKVITIAGTGKQAMLREVSPNMRKPRKPKKLPGALETNINSPWDIAKLGENFYIAMAGSHQIWVYKTFKKKPLDLEKATIEPFAGNGGESIVDGDLNSAAFSQPSGISADEKNKRLYVADSEVSAARYIDLNENKVRTLVGTGLFAFGDKDGDFDSALFQHGLGIDAAGEKVYFADTYNDRIKELDLEKKTVKTIFGSGQPGSKNGSAEETQFYEPAALSVLGDKIYIADTNNHKIRVADLKTGEVATLAINKAS